MNYKIEIYHSELKEWFDPMEISFNGEEIFQINCKKPGVHPMVEGYNTFYSKDMDKIAIRGNISLNPELFPK